MMMALRPLRAIIALLTGVAPGLVAGVMAATTPTGLAYLTIPRSGLSSITPTLRTRSKSRSVPNVLRRFLVILSGMLPRPVSSTAWRARISALLNNDHAKAVTASSTRSWFAVENLAWAARARARILARELGMVLDPTASDKAIGEQHGVDLILKFAGALFPQGIVPSEIGV